MLTNFEQLSDRSRIWIYQADRPLTQREQSDILSALESFLEQWAAHGQALYASGTIAYDHFLIIATDEQFNLASGCSIDSSVRFVQEMSARFSVDFFNRMNLAFKEGDTIKLVPMAQIKEKAESGVINENTLFFQNTIQTKAELSTSWIVKSGESWLKRYFSAAKIV